MTTHSGKGKLPPNVRIFGLTFAFFAAGVALYLFSLVSGIRFLPDLAEDQALRNPAGWFLAHLFVLGWATMVAMGASFQLTQVILRTSLFSPVLGYVHYVLYVCGFVLLTVSFAVRFFAGLFPGGILVLFGTIFYAVNLVLTFVRKKEWNPYVFGVSFSLFGLLAAEGLGVLMGAGFAYGWTVPGYDRIFSAHLWLGLGGWLSGLIITYSFKLLPMFYNSPRRAVTEAFLIIGLFQAGVWTEVVRLWLKQEEAAMLSMTAFLVSCILLARYVRDVRRQSRSSGRAGAVIVPRLLIPATGLMFLCWLAVDRFWPLASERAPWTETLLLFVILGWFSASILGYLSKIVPFLWWAYRFHTKWEKKSRVYLSDMLPDKRMTWLLSGYLFGIALVCAGLLLGLPKLALAGQVIAVFTVAVYAAELIRVFRF